MVVYLIGDSITQGLGSKKVNYTEQLKKLLGDGWQVINLACTGTTIDYGLKLLDEGRVVAGNTGGYCVILYGNVDAQIRPNSKGKVYPILPKRFQGNGMLMPRPFYSRSPFKRAFQRVENTIRAFLAKLVVRVDGTEQWVPIDLFAQQYEELITQLKEMNLRPVLCSCVYIDDKLFPGTPLQYENYNEVIKKLSKKYDIPYIDLYHTFGALVAENGWSSVYNYDHFHPNGGGYEVMAQLIVAALN